MKTIMLGIGDYNATNNPDEVLKTMALGSCVAVIILDPETRMIGMDHIALPDSRINKKKAAEKPGYFADTGIAALLNKMKSKGMKATGAKLIVKIIGGAQLIESSNSFNIGKRNVLAVKKVLWKYGMGAKSEDTGGKISRTVTVDAKKGRVIISVPGRDSWNI